MEVMIELKNNNFCLTMNIILYSTALSLLWLEKASDET